MSDTPITDAAASPTMFIDGEPVVEIKICRALERKLQKAQAEAALMREAIPFPAITKGNAKAMAWHVSNGEAFAGIDQQALSAWLNSVAAQLQNFESAALSSNAGRELLVELQRLRQLVSTIETETCENCNYQRNIYTPCKCGQFAVVGTNARLRSDLAKAQAQCAEKDAALKRCLPNWEIEPDDADGHICCEITNGDVRAIKSALSPRLWPRLRPPERGGEGS